MRINITAILLLLFFIKVNAQDITIYGSIKTNSGKEIIGASIFVNDTLVTISNKDGIFKFNTKLSDSIFVKVKNLGYKSQTKVVEISPSTTKYYLNFSLEIQTYELDEVTIKTNRTSLFEKEDWTILDYIIDNDKIIILNLDNTRHYLNIYNLNGKILKRKLLKDKYNEIIKSCLGGYHLVGNNYCQEFIFQNDNIVLKKKYYRKLFDKYIRNCIFKFESLYIFKSYSDFNKKITFYYFDKNKNKNIIANIIDEKAYSSAIDEYKQILNLYYLTIKKKNDSSLDSPFINNVLEDSNWNGDLDDLNISSELMFKIMWFKNISSKKIKGELIDIDNELFILNFIINKMIRIDIYNNNYKNNCLILPKCNNPIVNYDPIYDKNYLICGNETVYLIYKNETDFFLSEKYKIPRQYYFPKIINIYNNQLFFICYDNVKSTYNKIIKLNLN